MTTLHIGLLGLGTVGRGVHTILARALPTLTQLDFKLTRAAVRTLTPARQAEYSDLALTTDPWALVNDPDLDIIIEVMGGIDLPQRLLTRALETGKHVITANKDLIATHGVTLTALAQRHGVALAYEAAVMGGIPILQTLKTAYAGDTIDRLIGIANGTSNFILTQMASGAAYADALAQAQALGFAEADPTNDVEGLDAAYKLLILSRLAFGLDAPLEAIQRQGLASLTQADFAAARTFGYAIKPLITGTRRGQALRLTVSPTLVANTHPLSLVGAENNAVILHSTDLPALTLSGPGAGSLPTANAVVADLAQVATAIRQGYPYPLAAGRLTASTPLHLPAARLIALTTTRSIDGQALIDQLGLHGPLVAAPGGLHLLTEPLTDAALATHLAALRACAGIQVRHALPVLLTDR
ncbi:homoserine dehydrogenase [Lacticaseibacillus absianus]|uniref:homoserine dehydrogenase n=1 Tax=Lacticaseibacillus absianus TaxID=2729623 RepID=UPI0015C7EBB7|nr:homoserine dehydrogenase [Lacticaseibacillus absianus]